MSQFGKHIARIDAALVKHAASPLRAMKPWEPGALLFGGFLGGMSIFAALLVAGINLVC